MSRIGRSPISIPDGVDLNIDHRKVTVKGPKGNLSLDLVPKINAEILNGQLRLIREGDDKYTKSLHGLFRSLIQNMILGVTEGWVKKLEMVGVGYRAQGGGDTLNLNVGFSHPVAIKAPEGISFTVLDNTKIIVSGIDKALVGQVAANIRKTKPPEVYKGKGIRYEGEYVRKKPGKAGKAIGAKI